MSWFNKKRLECRVSELEDKVEKLVIESNCKAGRHEWETKYEYLGTYYTLTPDYTKPYVKCKHCHRKPS